MAERSLRPAAQKSVERLRASAAHSRTGFLGVSLAWLNSSTVLITLLAGAFLLSCVFLGWYSHTAKTYDYAAAGELLLVAVLSLEGMVAVRHLKQTRLESVHHVLVDVLRDYRSPEIFVALNALWNFRREHGDQFVPAYLARWKADKARIDQLPQEDQLAAISATLHYRRRLVKEFYNLLAGLYDIGVLPRDVLYTYWNETELRIIPEVLIPLETAVAQELRMETELGEWFERLQRLYRDSCP